MFVIKIGVLTVLYSHFIKSYTIGTEVAFPGGKADHSLSSSGQFKNAGAISSLPCTYSWRYA
jgi:hypothetical protein